MKSTGIVRQIDGLGRVVLPKEMRKGLGLEIGDPIEFCTENGNIVLKPYHAADEIKDLAIRIKDRLKSDGYSSRVTSNGIAIIGELLAILEEENNGTQNTEGI